MYQIREKLSRYLLWSLLLAGVIVAAVVGVPPFILLMGRVDPKFQLGLEIFTLMLLGGGAWAVGSEVLRRNRIEVTQEHAEQEGMVIEIGPSEVGMNLIRTDARGSTIRDRFLLETYNIITQSAVVATMDARSARHQEDMEAGIGHPVVILPIPSAPGSVRAAFSFHKSQRGKWRELLAQYIGGKQFAFKSAIWALGVSSSVIPTAYEFWKNPRAEATLHTVIATPEKKLAEKGSGDVEEPPKADGAESSTSGKGLDSGDGSREGELEENGDGEDPFELDGEDESIEAKGEKEDGKSESKAE